MLLMPEQSGATIGTAPAGHGGTACHAISLSAPSPRVCIFPLTEEGANICLTVVTNNTDDLVTWVHSYVTDDKAKTFCIYDAPSPEAIRRAARRNNLPVDKITEVKVLDPYFYR